MTVYYSGLIEIGLVHEIGALCTRSVHCARDRCTVHCNEPINNLSCSKGGSPLTAVRAVVGGRVLLPCNMTPPVASDATHLVLFYYGEVGTPIYSVDSRGVSLERASHWAEHRIRSRAYMMLGKSPRGLLLEKVHLKDEGQYRCRVDFLHSPTRNLRITLQVIVPPRKLTITSDPHPPRLPGLAGPFPEGAEVTLSCQVLGGEPRPVVTWWEEEALLDDETEVKAGHLTRNVLLLPPLTRSDFNKTLRCQAVNSDLTLPLSDTVTIDMNLPPSSVLLVPLTEGEVRLAEGEERRLVCEGVGAQPPAILQWWKNGEQVKTATQVQTRGQVARSTLVMVPQSADDGLLLTCRAFSPSLPHLVLHTSITISVLYKPRLELEEDPEQDLEDLQEGDDVTFTCLVDANPPVTGLHWAHNGVPVQADVGRGARAGSLTLRAVTRHDSGAYTCAAANTQGASTSNTLHLAVKFSPRCVEQQQTVYGAARHEQLCVPCQVWSYPAPATFRWAVNTSSGLVDVPVNLSRNSGSRSVVSYTPLTSHDFGDLLCWAVNDIGQQHQPCVFHIVPAAKPESVSECEVEREATMALSSVVVVCEAGRDGGLDQTFTVEVRQAATEAVLEAFRHAPHPRFTINGLKVGVAYLLTVTAANARGSSPPITLTYTATHASVHKVVSPLLHDALFTLAPVLVLVTGVMVAASVGVALLLTRRLRRKASAGRIVYTRPLKDLPGGPDLHAIITINRECEKDETMKGSADRVTPGTFYVNPATLLNNCGMAAPETDVLRERMSSLVSVDSSGRCSTSPSVTTACRTSSSPSGHCQMTTPTVALSPDHLVKGMGFLAMYPENFPQEAPAASLPHLHMESSV
ncbi:neural cell adhesion molecule 1-like [Procambarus clarkii]|uniref:neural cell adhesion molecule 1-like n=1 Tax=Procambarus clarkii TaxID=6728 RepID=UPI003741EB13